MVGEEKSFSVFVYLVIHVKDKLCGENGFFDGHEIVDFLGEGLV